MFCCCCCCYGVWLAFCRFLNWIYDICVMCFSLCVFWQVEQSYKANPKLLNSIQYCEDSGIPLMILIGSSEIENNVIKIRNIRTREEVNKFFIWYLSNKYMWSRWQINFIIHESIYIGVFCLLSFLDLLQHEVPRSSMCDDLRKHLAALNVWTQKKHQFCCLTKLFQCDICGIIYGRIERVAKHAINRRWVSHGAFHLKHVRPMPA